MTFPIRRMLSAILRRPTAALAVLACVPSPALSQDGPAVTLPPQLSFTGENAVVTVTMRAATSSPSVAAVPGVNALVSAELYDGLGRSRAVRTFASGGGGEDAVTAVDYDSRGRVWREHLPKACLPMGGGALPGTVPAGYRAYTEHAYEASPAGRPTLVTPPGPTPYPAATSYRLATQSDAVMMLYADSGGRLTKAGTYGSGGVRCTVTTDADGGVTHVFRDSRDSVVCVRRGGMRSMETYYVYDPMGRLCHVLPPDAADIVRSAGSGLFSGMEDIEPWAYSYRYDPLGRCVMRKLPGCGALHLAYDKSGLPCLETDAEGGGEGTFTAYDALRRPVMRGHVADASAMAEALAQGSARSSFTGTGTCRGYTPPLGAGTPEDVDVYYFYDDYRFLSLFGLSAVLAFTPAGGVTAAEAAPRGLLTGTAVRVLGSGTFLVRAVYYDDDRRPALTAETTHMGEVETAHTEYAFTGEPLRVIHRRLDIIGATVLSADTTVYAYDAAGRPSAETLRMRGKAFPLARAYDALGRLASVTAGPSARTVSYGRDPRGRLTSVTAPGFRQDVHREAFLLGQEYHSGRVSGVSWSRGDGVTRTYAYGYDAFGRLDAADYYDDGGGSFLEDGYLCTGADYSAGYSYDREDNLTFVMRQGVNSVEPGDGGFYEKTFGCVDFVEMEREGNRLSSLTDDAGAVTLQGAADVAPYAGTGAFSYDSRGRLTRDMTRGITRITYNHLGLPVTVTLSNGNSALFTYSGEGEKLRALYTATDMALFGQGATPVAVLVTTRVDYRPGRVYVGGGLAYAQVPGGYCTVSADTLSAHMTVSDYRGDVRSVIAEDGRVEERNDYYPYGMAFYSPAASVQPWKHSGKEHESRLGIHWLDFGARRLDFAKGQWTTVDPLCEKTPWQSPYAYCGADPVNHIDPDGRDDYFNEKGEFVRPVRLKVPINLPSDSRFCASSSTLPFLR